MYKKLLLLSFLLLLCSCGGPLSLVSYTLAGGVAMNAKQEEFESAQRDQYVNKCFPTHRKENPINDGIRTEASGNRVRSYEYYTIAKQLGYRDADRLLAKLAPQMSAEEMAQAQKNLKKYTKIHIDTCFLPAPH